jgi:hypothetical protein
MNSSEVKSVLITGITGSGGGEGVAILQNILRVTTIKYRFMEPEGGIAPLHQ